MASANIIAVFKDEGLTVKIDIRTISDNALVVEEADMTEMDDGAYKYIFTTYDETLDYLIICKDQYGNKVFAANDSVADLTKSTVDDIESKVDIIDTEVGVIGTLVTFIKKALWNKKILTGSNNAYTETLYDDDKTTPIRTHTIIRTAPEEQTRDNV